MQLDFPYHFDLEKRTARTSTEDNVRDMIEQLLFTIPGERVNRPDFGSGLLQMVFAPNSVNLAATIEFMAKAAIEQFLGGVIAIQELNVTAEDATLTVRIVYLLRHLHEQQELTLTRSIPS